MQRKHLTITAIVAFLPLASWAATHTADSCSYTDVLNALNAAANGDTVMVPEGTATWPSNLSIKKPIVLQGAGATLTVITMIGRIILNPTSDVSIRVTGFRFVGGSPIAISGSTSNGYCLTKIRVDHNSFIGGIDAVVVTGWVESLIDHNYFLNVDRSILFVGDNDYAWARPILAGTSHAMFVEDNTFKWTNGGGGGLNEAIYHQEGAKTVIRYNTFDGSEYTNYDFAICDSHGNFTYWSATTYPDNSRGQPLIEIYNNVYTYHHTYRAWYIRGGSIIAHDNAFNYVSTSVEFAVDESESYELRGGMNGILRTAWPACDQIHNSFFWSNTRNGVPITDIHLSGSNASVFIQKNRDYFMHAPASSGGYEYFTGARNGGSQSYPTETSDTGNMAFSPAGANAYYPYTPYQYPHPLQGTSGVISPDSPTGLRIRK
jgi:hypothetical protein